jgi:hypothetical protein
MFGIERSRLLLQDACLAGLYQLAQAESENPAGNAHHPAVLVNLSQSRVWREGLCRGMLPLERALAARSSRALPS